MPIYRKSEKEGTVHSEKALFYTPIFRTPFSGLSNRTPFSGPIRCLASDVPENSSSDAPEIGKSGFSDFRKSGFTEIRKSGNLKIRIFGFPEIQTFRNRISEIPGNRKIRIFGCSDFPDVRKVA